MSLPRAISVQAGSVPTCEETVSLTFRDRHRRRLRMTSSRGREFLLDLAKAQALADGDVLVLDDESNIRVVALDEDVIDITADDPNTLIRIAWHLGNRHLPTVVSAARLRIAQDHVIEEMVQGLGGKTERLHAPFQPEGGAYSHSHDAHDG